MPTSHGIYDHEILVGSTTTKLRLMRDEEGKAMYQVIEDIPQYQNPLKYIYTDWQGGHGQDEREISDIYYEGQSIDTTQPGRVFLGPLITTVKESDDTALDSGVVKFIWYPATSEWLCATAGKIYRYNVGSNLKWTAATTTVAGVTDLKVFGVTCFAGCGASTAYKYSVDGDTWTTSNLADTYANYFLVAPNAAGTADILWKAVTPNELKSNTSGINGGAAWSSAAYIGDTATNITNIFLCSNRLFVGKTSGLFYYDSDGGTHQMRPDLATNISTDNFKYVVDWQAATYHSEIDGMGEIWGSNQYEPMGPLTAIDDIGKRGDVTGLAADKDFLYVCIYDGTYYTIYKGRERRVRGALRWEWCPWVYLGTNACNAIAICQHTASDRRLWFGYGTNTGYVILSDNPTSDSAARFAASGFVRMSYDYGTNAKWDKLYQSVVTETKGCNATGETVTIKYRKNTDTGDATACTSAITSNGVNETNLSTALNCNRIQFEIALASDTSTATPEVSYFEAKGVEKPTTVRVHECVYDIEDEPSRRSSSVRTALRSARTSTSLVKFADLRYGDVTGTGTQYVWVVLQPGYPKEIEVLCEKGKKPRLGLQCRWQEVSFTVS